MLHLQPREHQLSSYFGQSKISRKKILTLHEITRTHQKYVKSNESIGINDCL